MFIFSGIPKAKIKNLTQVLANALTHLHQQWLITLNVATEFSTFLPMYCKWFIVSCTPAITKYYWIKYTGTEKDTIRLRVDKSLSLLLLCFLSWKHSEHEFPGESSRLLGQTRALIKVCVGRRISDTVAWYEFSSYFWATSNELYMTFWFFFLSTSQCATVQKL